MMVVCLAPVPLSSTESAMRCRRGMVLIIVAIVMALVSLAAMGFLVSMKTADRAAHLQADMSRVEQVAASGTEFLLTLARMPRAERSAWGSLQDNPSLFRDVRVDRDVAGTRHGRFCVVSPRYADESSEPHYEFGVVNTSAKLALRTVLLWDQLQPGSGRQALMNLPGMNESLADAILDWVDQDDEPREFGAEAEFYLGLVPSRQPPNQVPTRIEDLLAVRGMDAWRFFGKQNGPFRIVTSESGQLSATSPDPTSSQAMSAQADSSWLTPAPPWSHFLTVLSGERNESESGLRRIDLNQRDLSALQSALLAAFDQEIASFVCAYRQAGPAESTSIDAAVDEPIPATGARRRGSFRFATPLDLVDAVVELPNPESQDEENTIAYGSPFKRRDPSSLAKFVEFCDQTTTDSTPVLHGRINIQLAPRAVLLSIPWLTPNQVDQIINARMQQSEGTQSRVHASWLLAEGVVDLETMSHLWPFITVGGDVLRAQIVALYDAQSPWCRQEIVVDGTSDAPTPVYYRDLRRQGIGFRWQDLLSPTLDDGPATTGSSFPFVPGTRPERLTPIPSQ